MTRITIDARELVKLVQGIEKLQRQLPRAIARGLNEGGDKVRTQVQRALKKQAGFKRYSSVTARVRAARSFGEQGDLNYRIFVSGKKSKPYEFRQEVKRGPGGGVTVYFWGIAHKFPRSFAGSGRIVGQLLMRKSADRFPLRSFDGPNLAKEAVKDESARMFFATAETAVPDAVAKHIQKMLG